MSFISINLHMSSFCRSMSSFCRSASDKSKLLTIWSFTATHTVILICNVSFSKQSFLIFIYFLFFLSFVFTSTFLYSYPCSYYITLWLIHITHLFIPISIYVFKIRSISIVVLTYQCARIIVFDKNSCIRS